MQVIFCSQAFFLPRAALTERALAAFSVAPAEPRAPVGIAVGVRVVGPSRWPGESGPSGRTGATLGRQQKKDQPLDIFGQQSRNHRLYSSVLSEIVNRFLIDFSSPTK